MAQAVPAWKRLGLKLKYAKETAEVVAPPPASTGNPKTSTKRSREDEATRPVTPAKKQKTKPEPVADVQDSPSGLGIPSTERPNQTSTVTAATNSKEHMNVRPGLPRKKSVSFTPETKEEDGETGQIYFKTWAAENQQQPHTPPRPMNEQNTSDNDETPVKVSTETTTTPLKSKQASSQPPLKGKEAANAYVRYLEQYYNDKGNWKFNKAHQTALLKNLWNIYRIPPFLNDALVAYVSGLQGAAARQRLLEGADEHLKRVIEKTGGLMSSVLSTRPAEERRVAYDEALEQRLVELKAARADESDESQQKVEDLRREVEQEKRAVMLLLGALMQDFTKAPQRAAPAAAPAVSVEPKHMRFEEDAAAGVSAKVNAKPKAKRRRKARTDVSSSSESSSGSSSESSDSDSDSD